ncbi:hypothetical protein JQ557_00445 [Bradyrhizobium sp. U87765 SZCCT0131]|uniref:hypothetical protein n=1 Tax=unclassified Bradyrhizobium TaxID=2631580 RepID=UPI001BA6550E|nr:MULTISPECIES: hypothetical protein [unclassified Bradyrhizobium]MBR1216441.1 hypothetical protein [Bradyrhizobium sp. U87765 SZCCT0131]MBR1259810.1 hypothetical protein [Bradyrhizobium sp. U87765 SZCCT0134]MBR1305944.1 hypothetical protein [Bradyrhizobium sp. U87765 SZCCT0110]MBR1322311.1 hypothetical protein [Bradyrhizobium sp. U87765 SZCCT0109]MBR1352399.1 hypothetical protein [Bradyrhizobium sp. U87765 SZCCT0048]
MRTLGFWIGMIALMGSVSTAGIAERLPGIGTFAYNGPPTAADGPVLMSMVR